MVYDFTTGFWSVLILGAIALTIQEIVLYNRLRSLVQKIEDFSDLVISSYSSDKGAK